MCPDFRATGLAFVVMALAACGGAGVGPETFSDTGTIPTPGGNGGNSDYISGFGLPTFWSFPFDYNQGDVFQCQATGVCAHGASGLTVGNMGNGSDVVIFATTADFNDVDAGAGQVAVQTSAFRRDAVTLPTPPGGKKLRLAVDVAFLATDAEYDPGDDVVIGLRLAGSQQTVRLIQYRAADIGGTLSRKSGGCGDLPFDPFTTFDRCSDWHQATADISAYAGQSVEFIFIAEENGGDSAAGIALLIRRPRVEAQD